jgi:radical SAM enzyme (TIGR01210 family)
LTNQYFEVGIGLESSNDFVRINIINKGFTWNEFLRAKDLLHRFGFGVKAYLLFKPPFLEEYTAILDTYRSIRHCIEVGVDTISVNPTNIQMHTLCEELFNDNLFRPPWLYSLLILFKRALTPSDLRKIRIISDPSAAGKVRGINNGPNAAVNADFLQILQQFVLTQDLTKIPEFFSGANTLEYYTQLLLGNK